MGVLNDSKLRLDSSVSLQPFEPSRTIAQFHGDQYLMRSIAVIHDAVEGKIKSIAEVKLIYPDPAH